MSRGKLVYAQSGGVTAVINATASAVIRTARQNRVKVYAGHNGILGILNEDLIDTSKETLTTIRALAHTPGGAFGSCRFKLQSIEQDRARYERLIEVLAAHDIRYFLYNGGNDSADTVLKIAQVSKTLGYPLTCVGVPKTVDNDLAVTDCSPGFGSVAKYTALSVREASLDIASMAKTSTKVFILEVMGRHAGWIAAAAGLAGEGRDAPPHLILFPERPFDATKFVRQVQATVERIGWCVVVTSEGVHDADGRFLAEAGGRDAFGHAQLGGAAPALANLVKEKLGMKVHWALPDYLQRSARHIASATDLAQAEAVGEAAVNYALQGKHGVIPVIERLSDRPYRWRVVPAPLARVANHEKKLPRKFIRTDGYGITAAARSYLSPLIQGEALPPFNRDGLPRIAELRRQPVTRKLSAYQE